MTPLDRLKNALVYYGAIKSEDEGNPGLVGLVLAAREAAKAWTRREEEAHAALNRLDEIVQGVHGIAIGLAAGSVTRHELLRLVSPTDDALSRSHMRQAEQSRQHAAEVAAEEAPTSLRSLQLGLGWNLSTYKTDFLDNQIPHRDFAHALLHVTKAAGRIAAIIDDAEHLGGSGVVAHEDERHKEGVARYVADLVICAMRMANTVPGPMLDLQAEVERRLGRNDVKAERVNVPKKDRPCAMCGALPGERHTSELCR